MRGDGRIRIGYRDRTCCEPLFYPGRAHGFLCAPSRAGKFRDLIAEILFSWPFSCLYIDSKGQACGVTARYRHEKLGQEVYRLDPFNLMESLPGVRWIPPLAQFDPMFPLNPRSDTFAADSDNIAELCLPLGAHNERHWVDAGRGGGSGVIMYLKKWFPKETLATVYHIVSGPDLFLVAEDALRRAASGDETDGFIADRLARFASPDSRDNRETRSVISAMTTGLQFIGNKCIAKSLSGSTFDFGEMKRRPITVYLILPGQYLGDGNCSKWFSLIAGCAIDGWFRQTSRKVRVLGVFDEFKSAVGKLSIVETVMGLGAGYGIQLLNVFQNLSQLQELWPQGWETFLANSGYRVFFAPQDRTTSDYLSDMCGVTEIRTISKSLSEKPDGETSVNLSFGQHARKYMLPHETRNNLGKNEALIFGEGLPGVIRSGRRAYTLGEFRSCGDPDPCEYGGEKSRFG